LIQRYMNFHVILVNLALMGHTPAWWVVKALKNKDS
jgi:hypothetical protein